MSSEHLVGTSIPRFTFDTPTTPGNDFYALCAGTEPLCMIFLPGFDHPVTREYLTHYLKTYAAAGGASGWPAWCAQPPAQWPRLPIIWGKGRAVPSPWICDAPGVLYSASGVEQGQRGILPTLEVGHSVPSVHLQRSTAIRDAGYHYDRKVPDPLLGRDLAADLVGWDDVDNEGKTDRCSLHTGRSQTDYSIVPSSPISAVIRELAGAR